MVTKVRERQVGGRMGAEMAGQWVICLLVSQHDSSPTLGIRVWGLRTLREACTFHLERRETSEPGPQREMGTEGQGNVMGSKGKASEPE